MGVDHGVLESLMAGQFLNRPDIISIFLKMGGETMPQRVNPSLFDNKLRAPLPVIK